MPYVKDVACSGYKRPTGRPKKLGLRDSENLVLMYYRYPISIRELSKKFGVSTMTVWRVLRNKKFVEGVLNPRGD